MSSEALDPKLEATARLFAGDLELFFLRYVFPKARQLSAEAAEASEKIDALSEEDEDYEVEQSRLARHAELRVLEGLEFLLDKVRRAASSLAIRSFSRFANALEDEFIRGRVARACVERLSPLIAQLFALVDAPERAETWTEEFEVWLVRELQRIADIKTASSGSGATDQNAVDQRTQQIGNHVVSSQPPLSGTPAPAPKIPEPQIPDETIDRILLAPNDGLHIMVEWVKSTKSIRDAQAVLEAIDPAIDAIRSEKNRVRVRKAVYDSIPKRWKKEGEQDTLADYWKNQAPRSRIRGAISTFISGVKTVSPVS